MARLMFARVLAIVVCCVALAGPLRAAQDGEVKCTWLKQDDGICVDTTSKEHLCGGTIRYPEPGQAAKGINTYCKDAEGKRMGFKWQCCVGGVTLSAEMPELTTEEKGWHAKLLAGEYADKAKYDMAKGEFTEPAELQALFAKYAAKDGLTTSEMNKCDVNARVIGGDEMTCVDGLYPKWVHYYRMGLSNEMAPAGKANWAWPEPNQAKSRFAEAFWLSYFVAKCPDIGSVDRVPVNVRFFLKHLFKSNNNKQSGILGGGGVNAHVYCAWASSKAMIYGFSDWGYEVPETGWTWNTKFSKWGNPKYPVAPGDVLQYQSHRSPYSGHVATVVCRDTEASGTATNYDDATFWVVSGNAGPGGTVAVDRVKGAPLPSGLSVSTRGTWSDYAVEELAKEGQRNPELMTAADGNAKMTVEKWKATVLKKAEELKAKHGPKSGEAFVFSVNEVSKVQPWILDKVQSSGELLSEYKIRRTDDVAWKERMEAQGVHVTLAPSPKSILIKRGGYGPCSFSSEPGVCLKRNECPSERFYLTPKKADPLCPEAPADISFMVGCCLPSGITCGGGGGECFSPSFLPASTSKTFCTGFAFDDPVCKDHAKGSKCCVPAQPEDQVDDALKADVKPFLARDALAAQNIHDAKECTLKNDEPGLCLPPSAKAELCPGKLEFPSATHATGCEKSQWCCGSAGKCKVAGQTGECISNKVAASCPQRFGAQPSSDCGSQYLCCVPDAEKRKLIDSPTAGGTGSEEKEAAASSSSSSSSD